MARRRPRRNLFGALGFAMVLTAALPLAPGPVAPIALAADDDTPGWPVVESRAWIEDGYLTVVARVRNNYGGWSFYPNSYLRLYDAAGNTLDTQYGGFPFEVMAPGAFAWIRIQAAVPANYHHWGISVAGSTRDLRPLTALSVSIGAPFDDEDGRVYPFIVDGTAPLVSHMGFAVALYAADGSLVNVGDVGGPVASPDGWKFFGRFRDHFEGGVRAEVQGGPAIVRDSDPYAATWDNYFEDLDGFRHDIVWVANAGITKGCRALRYCPKDPVTRAQMATFLVRALDLPAASKDYFGDDESSSHEDNINRVASAGITSGCAVGRYCPASIVSRAQMASFLARAFSLTATSTDYFTDDESSSHEANINKVAGAGITTGCSPTTYCPAANVTRGQMAAFLHRALE
jgi:hypothetical protein